MTLHKKRIVLFVGVLLIAMVWAVSAGNLVDQRGVLAGRVVAQDLVAPGTAVKEGRVLVRVESITGPAPAVRATLDGIVREVLVRPGDMVRTGDVLIRIEPTAR